MHQPAERQVARASCQITVDVSQTSLFRGKPKRRMIQFRLRHLIQCSTHLYPGNAGAMKRPLSWKNCTRHGGASVLCHGDVQLRSRRP